MAFECEKCGACCEILPTLVYGRPCEHYDKQIRLCRIYETRPDICRTKEDGLHDQRKQNCNKLRELRQRWTH